MILRQLHIDPAGSASTESNAASASCPQKVSVYFQWNRKLLISAGEAHRHPGQSLRGDWQGLPLAFG